ARRSRRATPPKRAGSTRRGCPATRKQGRRGSKFTLGWVVNMAKLDPAHLPLEHVDPRGYRVESATDDRMIISVGPHHPSTHGVLRLIVELEGETVVDCVPEIGFLHTGIEKTAEALTWEQAITVIDRMDYLSMTVIACSHVSASAVFS